MLADAQFYAPSFQGKGDYLMDSKATVETTVSDGITLAVRILNSAYSSWNEGASASDTLERIQQAKAWLEAMETRLKIHIED